MLAPSSPSHLSEEALLLLTTNELPPEAVPEAERHLEACAECRQKLELASGLRNRLQQAFQKHDEQRLAVRLRQSNRSSQWIWPVSAVAAVIAFVVYTSLPPRLSAKEVLDTAVLAETRRSAAPQVVRIRSGSVSCALSLATISTSMSACAPLQQTLDVIPWDWRNPLSVRTFRRWRDGLTNKTDSVRKAAATITITTRSSDSPIRVAEMTLVSSDYTALRTSLEIQNNVRIEISEESAVVASTNTVTAPRPIVATQPAVPRPVVPADNPADVAEVNAWLTLGRLNHLDGWTSTVRRSGDIVETIDVTGPKREIPSMLPDLAVNDKWMKRVLPPGRDLSGFQNDVLTASQRVLGFATARDASLERRPDLAGCSCVHQLDLLIETQDRKLLEAIGELAALLQPVLNAILSNRPLLTSADAHRLDATLMHMFFSARDEAALQDDLSQIRVLLGQ